jgi:hypothetical protein
VAARMALVQCQPDTLASNRLCDSHGCRDAGDLLVDGWTVSGWVIGALGTAVGVSSFYQQRRSAPALDKLLTDYEAQHTGEQVEELQHTLSSLERQLRGETCIPRVSERLGGR